MQEALTAIAGVLRGHGGAVPAPAQHAAIVEAATAHGVAPLLASQVERAGWTGAIVRALKDIAATEAALAVVRQREVRKVTEALASAAVPALLIKGAHLSRTYYDAPEHRPHGDVDVLIKEDGRAAAGLALEALGYKRLAHVSGDVAFTQVHYWRADEWGARHAIDLHWRVCAPRVFADRLRWDELYSARRPIPGLGPSAHGPSPPHALLIACIHRTAHHNNSERLIWLYDLHALASRLTASEWQVVADTAAERRITPIVLSGLDRAGQWLGTTTPPEIAGQLSSSEAGADPAAVAFLRPGRAPIDVLLSDLRALRGWGLRVRFVREHVFPPPAYMAHRYGIASRAALPFLYLHRMVVGIGKWW